MSKLQMCIRILCALVINGPLKLTQLTHKIELDKANLNSIMDFLYDRCLVGEQNLDDGEKAYFVTDGGLSVLKVVAPLVKEAQRIEMHNFEAVSTVLSEAEIAQNTNRAEKQKRKWKLLDFIKIKIV